MKQFFIQIISIAMGLAIWDLIKLGIKEIIKAKKK